MVFADLKNDFVFRRIFGTHPDILRGLLNDLLDRQGEHAIQEIEYLPSEQIPDLPGLKLSILDVRCRERSGATFIVEMQIWHVPGFLNRVVYNACKAYVQQLRSGAPYSKLADVVAISICDFELWPDAQQDAAGNPRVPMLSRWNMKEQQSGNDGLLQVQYVFLELPKLPAEKPESGAELWAWVFRYASEMTEVPSDLPAGPYREAVELANEAGFNQHDLDAYRRVMDEIQQARDYGDARQARGIAEGEARGAIRGKAEGKAEAVLSVLKARGIDVDEAACERILACTDSATLDRWIARAATASSMEEVIAESR